MMPRYSGVMVERYYQWDQASLASYFLDFQHFYLQGEGTLSYEFTEPFRLLSEAVKATNSSKVAERTLSDENVFEPGEYALTGAIKRRLDSLQPNWLPRGHDTRIEEWVREYLLHVPFSVMYNKSNG